MISVRTVSALAVLALTTDCIAVPPPRSTFPTADAALERMKATSACVNGVRGDVKLDVFSSQSRIRAEVLLLAVNPDRVRFDLVVFGTPLYTLTSNGARFGFLDIKEKQLLVGPATPCNLARLTQVPLPGHALVSLLRGEAPVLVHQPANAGISWDERGGFYRILIKSTHEATEEIHLEVHPGDIDKPWSRQRMRTTWVQVAQRGVRLYDAELKRFQAAQTSPAHVDPEGIDDNIPPSGPMCNVELPRWIRVQSPNTGDDVLFLYKEANWNPPLLPGAFEQKRADGVSERYVSCDR